MEALLLLHFESRKLHSSNCNSITFNNYVSSRGMDKITLWSNECITVYIYFRVCKISKLSTLSGLNYSDILS